MKGVNLRNFAVIFLLLLFVGFSSAACTPHGQLTINGVEAEDGTVVSAYYDDAGKGEVYCGQGAYDSNVGEWSLECAGAVPEYTMIFYVDSDPTIVLEGNPLWVDNTSPLISLEAPNDPPRIDEYLETVSETYRVNEAGSVSVTVTDRDHGGVSLDNLRLFMCEGEEIENVTGCVGETFCVSEPVQENTLTCSFNFEFEYGSHDYTLHVMDEHGLVGSGDTVYNFFLDSIGPTIIFEEVTSGNVNQNWIYVSLRSPSEDFQNLTVNLYSLEGLEGSESADYDLFSYNFTDLDNGTYHLNVTSFDVLNNINHTETISIYLGAYCGNTICSSEESCSSCEFDCGECEVPEETSPSTKKFKGGGSSCLYDENYNWECSDWSVCEKGYKTRDCKEYNNCGSTYDRPSVKESCEEEKKEVKIPADLFDIKLDLEERRIINSKDLTAIVTYDNFGGTPTYLEWVFDIYDSQGNFIHSQGGDILVEIEEFQRVTFNELDLAPGKYKLVFKIQYGEEVYDEFEEPFYVGEEYIIPSFMAYFIDEEGKYLIFVLILAIIAGFSRFYWVKYSYEIQGFFLKKKYYDKKSKKYIIRKESGDY